MCNSDVLTSKQRSGDPFAMVVNNCLHAPMYSLLLTPLHHSLEDAARSSLEAVTSILGWAFMLIAMLQ